MILIYHYNDRYISFGDIVDSINKDDSLFYKCQQDFMKFRKFIKKYKK